MTHRTNKILISCVWLINGLYCKVLGMVPRHQQIVEQILGNQYSKVLTILIGFAEIIMAIWIMTNFKRRLNVYLQIGIIGVMNIIELVRVPHLLLWGKLNALFALAFMTFIFYNEFILKNRSSA